jgi:predicted DNA-binding transcriptional regulator AlpA
MNTARRSSHLPPQLAPRLIGREAAAEYVGVGCTTFTDLVSKSNMPQPVHIGTRVLWDVRQLDRAIDRLAGSSDEGPNEWDGAT